MTKEELLVKIEQTKRNSVLSEKAKEAALKMFHEKLKLIDNVDKLINAANSTNASVKDIAIKKLKEIGLEHDGKPICNKEESINHRKNIEIIDSFYKNNQTYVTKEELIEKGFDFSQWFSTSSLKHYFDNEENIFEFKDFKCGSYFIKTRDKNLEKPNQQSRLFFQLIKTDIDNERINAELKLAIKLLKERKYAARHAWAYSFDNEMRNEFSVKQSKEELESINIQIKHVLPRIKMIIDGYKINHDLFLDLYERLQKEDSTDEKWV